MSDSVKVALILSVAIITAVAMWIYFSPYQSCLRRGGAGGIGRATTYFCAEATR